MFYSISDFIDKYKSYSWLFGFLITAIIFIIICFFADYFYKFKNKQDKNFFKIEKDIKKLDTVASNKAIEEELKSTNIINKTQFKKVKKPTRSEDQFKY